MTLTELLVNLSANTGLDTTAGTAERTRLILYLNEAVVQVLLDTACTKTVGSMTLTAGTGDYTLDTDIMAITDIDLTGVSDSQRRRLERLHPEDIDQLRRAEGTPPSRYYATDGNLLMVYPTPTAADTINFRYIKRPTAMSTGTNDPSNATYGGIPVEYHQAIEYYASARAAASDASQSVPPKAWLDLYVIETAKIRARVLRRGGRKLPNARLGGARVVKTTPSTDV